MGCGDTLEEMLEIKVYEMIYAPCVVDWGVLNNMGCGDTLEEMLEIKVYEMVRDEEIFTCEAWRRIFDINESSYTELIHEFYATCKFDETVTDEDLMSKKVIKFKLGGRGHTLTILEFALCFGLNTYNEIQDKGFETYFLIGLRDDDHFNVNQYWLQISSENELIMSRSSTRTIRKSVLRVSKCSLVDCKVAEKKRSWKSKGEHDLLWKFITKIARRANLLTDEVLDGLSALVYCRPLDSTTLREVIDSNRRLIIEESTHGDPRVAIPRTSRHSISDIYDRMGRMEIQV
nr:hypothetical protein [Tanacetum cinerariifolium]